MKSDQYADFHLSEDEHGKHAIGHGIAITLEGGTFFHRRCIKQGLNGGPTVRDSMLVAEIDGVRIYVKPPGNIIMTKRNLRL